MEDEEGKEALLEGMRQNQKNDKGLAVIVKGSKGRRGIREEEVRGRRVSNKSRVK
jgi:hypothetical protein